MKILQALIMLWLILAGVALVVYIKDSTVSKPGVLFTADSGTKTNNYTTVMGKWLIYSTVSKTNMSQNPTTVTPGGRR